MARPIRKDPWLEKHGEIFYAAWYEPDNRRSRRKSLKTTDRHEANKALARMVYGGMPSSGAVLCSAVLAQYLAEHVQMNCADPGRQNIICAHLNRFFGNKPIKDIRIPNSRAYATFRNASSSTVKRELSTLMAAANFCRRWGSLPAGEMPVVEFPKVKKSKVKFFTVDQIGDLIKESYGPLRVFIVIGYFTGARRAAIEGLKWSQVDTEHRVVDFHDYSRPETRKRNGLCPINDAVAKQLNRMKARFPDSEYVFNGTPNFYRPFVKLCARMLPGVKAHPHMLRHSRATHLLEAGQSIYRVAGLLGDTVATVERNYGHHTPEHAAGAVAPGDDYLAGI